MIRICTPDDLPWLMTMVSKYYGHMVKNYEATESWFKDAMNDPNHVVLRNDGAFLLAEATKSFYDDKTRGEIHLFAGGIFSLVSLMKKLKQVGQDNDISWVFSSTTGWNIRKLAKILGAKEVQTYIMEPVYG